MPRNRSTTVTASPALAAETAVCTVANLTVPPGDVIDFDAFIDLTVGTSGSAVTLKLRRGGDATGTVIATFGPFTAVAANRINLSANAQDVQQAEQQNLSYTLTVTVTAGAAQSTVNNVYLGAIY